MTVSVVIPAYNVAWVLPQTVPKVLALKGVSEWIWVDDGSTDTTVSELERLAGGHPGVRILKLGQNRGRGAARNAGFEGATSDLIAFLDADASPRAGYLDAHLQTLKETGARVSIGRVEPADPVAGDPYSIYLASYPRGPQRDSASVSWKHFVTCAVCIRTEVLEQLGGFNTAIGYGEDAELACRLAQVALGGLSFARGAIVDLYGTETLDGALSKARQFGQSLRKILVESPDALEILELTGLQHRLPRALLSSHPLARFIRSNLSVLPPALVPMGVRYLLGQSLYRGFSNA